MSEMLPDKSQAPGVSVLGDRTDLPVSPGPSPRPSPAPAATQVPLQADDPPPASGGVAAMHSGIGHAPTSAVTYAEPDDDFLIEAVATGMILAGAGIGAGAWYQFRARRT